MDIKTYQELSVRTLNMDLTADQQIMNMGLGVCGEGGEIADAIKKAFFQGHYLDKEHLAEEIGDVMFYLSNLATLLGFKMEDILQGNIDKLKKRYTGGFDSNRSINREV